MLISIFAALMGTVFGGLICFMRMSKKKVLLYTAKGYISLLRGTPVLVLLMIIYYIVFASVNINPVLVAMIAFGLNFAAYVSEMFRTSMKALIKVKKKPVLQEVLPKYRLLSLLLCLRLYSMFSLYIKESLFLWLKQLPL